MKHADGGGTGGTNAQRLRSRYACFSVLSALLLASCGESATLSVKQGQGENPELPAPKKTLIPTVNIAEASSWPVDASPLAAAGFRVNRFAEGLDHPRWLYVLPNGDVLVAESNAQPKPPKGIRGRVMALVMKRAGAAVPSADRITLLRDADGDGSAEFRSVFLSDLTSPFGMALVGQALYVANTDSLVKFSYEDGQTRIDTPAELVTELPAGKINHHWTKSLVASTDGSKLYVGVGSNSNVGENGMDMETNRAAILEIDPESGQTEVYASGLRNPVGMDWQPDTGALWVAVNERDELGSDLVPDYMTSVRRGGFYGWPYSYYGQYIDTRVEPQRPDLVESALVPDYALGPHTASLGLEFYTGTMFPEHFRHGVFVGQHGSWNRNPKSGYKVIFVPFSNGMPAGEAQDILSGFINDKDEAMGRPVDVAVDNEGALLTTDDVGNIVWRVISSEGL